MDDLEKERPLCFGSGPFDGDTCPECDGDRQMQRRYAEQVDSSRYDKEDCVVCRGTGQFFKDTYRVCDGERFVKRRQNEVIDMWDYKLIACPNCKGCGCGICDSVGQLPRYLATELKMREAEADTAFDKECASLSAQATLQREKKSSPRTRMAAASLEVHDHPRIANAEAVQSTPTYIKKRPRPFAFIGLLNPSAERTFGQRR